MPALLHPPKKILAIKLRALGDTVIMTASLAQLRKAFPRAEIHALVLNPWKSLLEGHPGADKIIGYDRHNDAGARAKAIARLALKLRPEAYDCVVNFHASPSSSILAFATGAKLRSIHFHGHRDKNRYSTATVPGKGILKPIVERDLDTVRALGIPVPTGNLPQIFISESERAWGSQLLFDRGLTGPILGLGLGASRPTKMWSTTHFAQVALKWCKEKNGSVLAVAGPDETRTANDFLSLCQELGSRVQIATQFSVRQLSAVLANLSCFAGNDSGPRHIAVAVGTPTVTLFGPEHPFEWHPYSEEAHPKLFIDNLACRKDADPGMPPWCGLNECIVEKNKCLQMISEDQVFEQIIRVSK